MDTKFFVVTSLDKNNNEAGDFTEEPTLGVNDIFRDNAISIYPNPYNSQINIALATTYFENTVNVQLYDLTGRIVYNKEHTVYNKKIQI